MPVDSRAEGIAEPAGDIILACTGGNPTSAGQPIPPVDISVSVNTNVTSRLVNGSATTSEALLLINEPAPGALSICTTPQTGCPLTSLGTGGAFNSPNNLTYSPSGVPGRAAFNGYQGVLTAPSQVTFFGVPLDPPGNATSYSGSFPSNGAILLRVTNIRVNSSGIGASTGATFNQVSGFISTSAGFTVNNSVATISNIRRGLILSANNAGANPPVTASVCFPPISPAAALVETVSFSKGYGSAFKPRSYSDPNLQATTGTTGLYTESQFVPLNNPAAGALGLADSATRVKLTLNNVPDGVSVYVPLKIGNLAGTNLAANSLETFQLVTSETAPAGTLATAVTLSIGGTSVTGYSQIKITAGTGTAVYELATQSTSPANAQGTITNFQIPVIANYTASASTGATTYSMDFAPSSTITTASATAIPRFVSTASPVTGFTIAPCSSPAPLSFIPITPCRILDTRGPPGMFGGPNLAAGVPRDFPLTAGNCPIPATALAYSLNTAVVPQGSLGFLTLWPTGKTQPYTSILNSDGRVKSNASIVAAGTNGSISAYASNGTDLILDINGYFVPATTPSSLAFYPVAPCRVADTRNPTGPLGGPSLPGGTSRTFPILSSACGIPPTAQAYSVNLAAVPKGTLGYLTAWPTGNPQPFTAALNAPTGAVTANASILPSGSFGGIDIFASNATDLVIDIDGYFAPPGTGGLSFYALNPCRFLDTRYPQGSAPLTGTATQTVSGLCSASLSAKAFAVSATVVPTSGLGYLTLWPANTTQPYVATLSANDGAVSSNLALVPGTSGAISVFVSNSTHLILDLFGYFAP